MDALLPYLDEALEAYQADPESGPTLPKTIDGKVNVEGLVKALIEREPELVKRSDTQHFHNRKALKEAVDQVAAQMELAPIGARTRSPEERLADARIKELSATEKRASEDSVSLRRQIEHLTLEVAQITKQRDRYKSALRAIYQNGELPAAVVEELLRDGA